MTTALKGLSDSDFYQAVKGLVEPLTILIIVYLSILKLFRGDNLPVCFKVTKMVSLWWQRSNNQLPSYFFAQALSKIFETLFLKRFQSFKENYYHLQKLIVSG